MINPLWQEESFSNYNTLLLLRINNVNNLFSDLLTDEMQSDHRLSLLLTSFLNSDSPTSRDNFPTFPFLINVDKANFRNWNFIHSSLIYPPRNSRNNEV